MSCPIKAHIFAFEIRHTAALFELLPIGPKMSLGLLTGHSGRYIRGTVSLIDLARGRTDGGGLLSLEVNPDQRHSAHPLAAGGHHVATSPQVGLHCFGEGVGHREAAQAGTLLTEGADEMRGREARRLKRLLGTHA